MKRYMTAAIGIFVSLFLPFMVLVPSTSAIDFIGDSCENNAGDGVCPPKGPGKSRDQTRTEAAKSVVNIIDGLLYLIGAVAIIMIVFGGFRYITSRGESGAIESAKNIILYAVIGLALALLAKVIVTFVIGEIL